jgi:hypothetical protein
MVCRADGRNGAAAADFVDGWRVQRTARQSPDVREAAGRNGGGGGGWVRGLRAGMCVRVCVSVFGRRYDPTFVARRYRLAGRGRSVARETQIK